MKKSYTLQSLLHPFEILRRVQAVNEGVMGMERVGNRFASAIANHFAEGYERNTPLSLGHHGMVERRKGDAASNCVIDNVLTGVWAFQTSFGLHTPGFGNELGCELLEVLRESLKRKPECAIWPRNGG